MTSSIETAENWYWYVPESLCEHVDTSGRWNQGVQTDADVLESRADIIIKNKKEFAC